MKQINKKISLKIILLSCLFILSLYIFYRIADEAVLEKETGFDNAINSFRVKYAGAGLINAMKQITFFGSSMFLLPAYLILLVFFLFKKKYRYATAIGLIGIITTAIMFALKKIFHRNRPEFQLIERVTDYSFPSGHAFSSLIFFSVLAYIVWRSNLKLGWKWTLLVLLMLAPLVIGISRIVLNVHFATDVIAGFCLGIMWALISFWAFKKYAE